MTKRRVVNAREMIRLLLDGVIHVKLWTNEVEWLTDDFPPGLGRAYALAKSRKLFADTEGLFILA